MKKAALVTFKESPGLTPDDSLLPKPFAEAGIEAAAAPWDDENINWAEFDVILIRSPWNYFKLPDKFSGWLTGLEKINAPVINPIPILRKNMHKTYMRELNEKGVKIPHTAFFEKGVEPNFGKLSHIRTKELIIKPIISGGAWNTSRLSWSEEEIIEDTVYALINTHGVMVQEFIPEVVEKGEWSHIYFNGEYSHSLLKRAKPGDYRVQDDHGGTVHEEKPPAGMLEQVDEIVRKIDDDPVYARIDGVDVKGEFTLMELELLEPELFFRTGKDSIQKFIGAIKNRMNWE